jgi:hypothetical protein
MPLALLSLLACATATYDGDPGGSFGGAGDAGGTPGEGGGPTSGAPNAGAMQGGAGAPPVAGSPNGGAPGHAGGAGAPAGGHSGNNSTGGTSGAAGKAGASGKAGGGSLGGATGMGGGSGGAANDGPCDNPVDIKDMKSGDVGLAGGCFRTTEKFNSIGCSNFTGGRTIKVNGKLDPCAGTKTTFAPMIGGYNYFEVSAGNVTYASFYWFSS